MNLLVSSDAGGTVIVWDGTDFSNGVCQALQTIRENRDNIYSVRFSPDGSMVAVGDRDGSARLWDLEGNQLGEFPGHTSRIWSLAFSPDGKSLLTSDN